jgi:hypothetical protein
MSPPLKGLLDPFKGKFIKDCEDQIELIAKHNHMTVCILDPANGGGTNIDVEANRLDVTIDADMRVVKFAVG